MRLHGSEPALVDLEDVFLCLAPRNRAAAGRMVERIAHVANDILAVIHGAREWPDSFA